MNRDAAEWAQERCSPQTSWECVWAEAVLWGERSKLPPEHCAGPVRSLFLVIRTWTKGGSTSSLNPRFTCFFHQHCECSLGVLNKDTQDYNRLFVISLSTLCLYMGFRWRSDHILRPINAQNQVTTKGSHTFTELTTRSILYGPLSKPKTHIWYVKNPPDLKMKFEGFYFHLYFYRLSLSLSQTQLTKRRRQQTFGL